MTGSSLAAAWAAVAAAVASHATFAPPALDAATWDAAASGEVVRRTLPGDPATVLGVGVLPISREAAWLSLTDDQLSAEVSGLTEVALRGHWASPKLLYQRIDLPWPFADRHWVIALTNNAPLARAAGVWERAWTLDADALEGARDRTDPAAFAASTAVDVNEGSWLLLALDAGHTLGIYQARATLGGGIPDGAVDTYTRSSLRGLFDGITRNGANVRGRYGTDCTAQPGPDGASIPCFETK